MSRIRIRALLNTLNNTIDTQLSKQRLTTTQESIICINSNKNSTNNEKMEQEKRKYNYFSLVYDEFLENPQPNTARPQQQKSRNSINRLSTPLGNYHEKKMVKKVDESKTSFTTHKRQKTCEQNIEQLGIGKKRINFKIGSNSSQIIPNISTIDNIRESPKPKTRDPLNFHKRTVSQSIRQQSAKSDLTRAKSKPKNRVSLNEFIRNQKTLRLVSTTKSKASGFRAKIRKQSVDREQFKICAWDHTAEPTHYPLCC